MEKSEKSIHIAKVRTSNIEYVNDSALVVKKLCDEESSPKILIKIKVPKVRFETRPERSYQVSDSPMRPLVKILQPMSLNDEISISASRTRKGYKTPKPQHIASLSNEKKIKRIQKNYIYMKGTNTSENLPKIKKKIQTLKKPHENSSVYFELLGFVIKKHLDYEPLYKKIDTEGKGYFDKHDLMNFFYINSVNCDIEETVQSVFTLGQYINLEQDIKKRTFFAMCSVNDNDSLEENKLFSRENLGKLSENIGEMRMVFKEFTKGFYVSRNNLLDLCRRYPEESVIKAAEIVASEQIDFSRFLICLPFFMWARACSDIDLKTLHK